LQVGHRFDLVTNLKIGGGAGLRRSSPSPTT
jgi:hypothetical protein